jgi:osmoprotectant transport system permease protein
MLSGATRTPAETERIVVGSKKFTENVLLAEIMAQLLEVRTGLPVERRFNLAGTQVCFDALRRGEIDLYPEYTGTGLRNILGIEEPMISAGQVFATLSEVFRRRFELLWLAPFGFNNTYVLIVNRDTAKRMALESISDLTGHPLRYGISHEFLQRPDGMPGLRRVYGLDEASTVGLEHDIAYQGLREGAIDVSDGYSTDAKILRYGLISLRDDKAFFPPYEAAPLARRDFLERVPEAGEALRLLAGRLDAQTMQQLNFRVEEERFPATRVASEFLATLGVNTGARDGEARRAGLLGLLWQRRWETLHLTGQHLFLTVAAVALSALLGFPLGVAASQRPRLARLVLTIAGIFQTIPSIALLDFMLPLFGIGPTPAVIALFLYGLLPILRNTITGLRNIDGRLIEVGRGLGMRPGQLLWQVELPIAAPVLLAGVRTATVIAVGTATLAAFIGAGGLGDPIVTGLSTSDFNLVLTGALPAAALAIAMDTALGGIERLATPRGLRI